MKYPLVAEIKRNSLDDGPGVRSVVFFKGCPLSCVWCHNPECIDPDPEIMYKAETCIGCGECAKVCPKNAIGPDGPAKLDREKCDLCGKCVDECPSGALSMVGKRYEVLELADLLARDKAFYDNSGGGVTLSGGEPTMFMDYVAELARELKGRGIRVLLETSGMFEWDRFKNNLLPHLDRIFVDMKIVDPEDHKKYAGLDSRRIQENIARLAALDTPPVLIRTPLIPGVTATPGNLIAIASRLKELGVGEIGLLPYNPLWVSKARAMDKDVKYSREEWMSKEERESVKKIFAHFKLARDF